MRPSAPTWWPRTRQAAEYGLHEIAWKLPVACNEFLQPARPLGRLGATHRDRPGERPALGDRRAEAWMLNNLGMVFGHAAHGRSGRLLRAGAGHLPRDRRPCRARPGRQQPRRRLSAVCDASRRRSSRCSGHSPSSGNGSRYGEAIALHNLGEAYRELGRFDDAIDLPAAGAGDLPFDLGDRPRKGLTWRSRRGLSRPGPGRRCHRLPRDGAGHPARDRDRHGEARHSSLGHADRRAGRYGTGPGVRCPRRSRCSRNSGTTRKRPRSAPARWNSQRRPAEPRRTPDEDVGCAVPTSKQPVSVGCLF